MNGIIHPCTHPEDRPAPETEDEMFVSALLLICTLNVLVHRNFLKGKSVFRF